MTSKLNVLTDQCRAAVCEVTPPQLAASLVDQFLSTNPRALSECDLSLRPSRSLPSSWTPSSMCRRCPHEDQTRAAALREGAKVMAVEATWHVKLTRRDHSRIAFTDYLNRVPKRRAIITLHIDGKRVKLRIDVVHEQPRGQRAASLGVFDVLATEVD